MCALGDLKRKLEDFDWYVQEVDGHDVAAIYEAIQNAKAQSDKPAMIVLNTVKGHGWSAIENQVSSHSMNVSAEQLAEALAEMEAEVAKLTQEV